MMNMQQAFDHIVRNLRKQNAKSHGPYIAKDGLKSFGCLYRDGDGNKCAAGHCIPDDKYTKDLEGLSVNNEKVQSVVDVDFTIGTMYLLMSDMQSAHDSYSVHQWPDRWRQIAADYNLNPAIITAKIN
jgi:hypothetical protein